MGTIEATEGTVDTVDKDRIAYFSGRIHHTLVLTPYL